MESGPSSSSMLDRLISAENSVPSLRSPKLEAGAHRTRSGIGEEARAVPGVDAAEPLRDQGLDRLAEQFFSRVPEQGLGLGVDEHDVPIGADSDDRIGGELEELLEPAGNIPVSLHLRDLGRLLGRRACAVSQGVADRRCRARLSCDAVHRASALPLRNPEYQ